MSNDQTVKSAKLAKCLGRIHVENNYATVLPRVREERLKRGMIVSDCERLRAL
jgi:hypothetical protein